MSYPANIDDISSFFENNRLEQNNHEVAAKNLRSSNKERTESKGAYSNKFQEDEPILLQDERLYDRERKMNSVEENTEDENEEDGVQTRSDSASLDRSSSSTAINKNADNRLRLQVPYTSSPHPQRHSRWTS